MFHLFLTTIQEHSLDRVIAIVNFAGCKSVYTITIVGFNLFMKYNLSFFCYHFSFRVHPSFYVVTCFIGNYSMLYTFHYSLGQAT